MTTLSTPLEIAEFYEGPGSRAFPEAHPTIVVNAEDYATILAEIRRLSALETKLAESERKAAAVDAMENLIDRYGDLFIELYDGGECYVDLSNDGGCLAESAADTLPAAILALAERCETKGEVGS